MLPEATNDAVPAHEVGLEVLKKSIQSSHDANDHAKLVDELEQLTKARALVDSMVRDNLLEGFRFGTGRYGNRPVHTSAGPPSVRRNKFLLKSPNRF